MTTSNVGGPTWDKKKSIPGRFLNLHPVWYYKNDLIELW